VFIQPIFEGINRIRLYDIIRQTVPNINDPVTKRIFSYIISPAPHALQDSQQQRVSAVAEVWLWPQDHVTRDPVVTSVNGSLMAVNHSLEIAWQVLICQ